MPDSNPPTPISVAAVERNKARIEELASNITFEVEELMRLACASVLNIHVFDDDTGQMTHTINMQKTPPKSEGTKQ